MQPHAVVRAVGHYLTTTTLHGFKYLLAPYSADRVAWLLSCMASACCAGVLCGVLWSRFTQVPNLLSLRSLDVAGAMPLSGLCLPTEVLAHNIIYNLIGSNYTKALTKPLSQALLGKPTHEYKLAYIEYMLKIKSVTLNEALVKYSPPCSEIATRCRVNREMVDCDRFISRDFTPYGFCCVAKPSRLNKYRKGLFAQLKLMEMIINVSTSAGFSGYNFITQFEGKEWVKSSNLVPGYMYTAPLTYNSIVGGDSEHITDKNNCIFDKDYLRIECYEICAENACGCLDPLRSVDHKLYSNMHICPLAKISCLRQNVDDCDCPPSCRKISTYMDMSLEFTPMNALPYVIDPLYVGLNGSEAISLQMSFKMTGSHVFSRMPTETWLTLLSSLGGVFNMFLGVGLFSALELLYFLFVRIPMAVRRSLEIEVPTINQT